MHKNSPDVFPIVVVGGSAGGLKAFTTFFKALDKLAEHPGMAFVVVSHISPDQKSYLAEILQKVTRMPVAAVADRSEIAVDHVYVLSPGRTIVAREGGLVSPGRTQGAGHHPVDDMFESLARAYGEAAVAVVCSGTGSNGSAGLTLVHQGGGLVLAQAPETAEFDEMPRRAIDTGMVDAVLPPEEMPRVLMQYRRRLNHRGPAAEQGLPQETDEPEPAGPDDGPPDPLRRILAALLTHTSIDFRDYKSGTLRRRIERRLALLGLDDWAAYASLLEENPEEAAALREDFLITVTAFFRDDEEWEVLAEKAVAPLVAGREADRPLRAWVAGCATGEEAYSLAILLFEAVQAAGTGVRIEIFATDVSARALARARRGHYPAAAVQNLSADRQKRWFDIDDDIARVNPMVREAVVFAPQNLIQDPPFSRMDIVLCRNVLIYLKPTRQKRLIRLFHFALAEGGFLFLGNAESIDRGSELFAAVDKGARLFRRLGPTRYDLADFSRAHLPSPDGGVPPAPARRADTPRAAVAEGALQALAARYAPPSIVVDGDFNVLYYLGETDRFLKPQAGAATHDLLTLSDDGLTPHLRHILGRAKRTGKRQSAQLRAGLDGRTLPLRIEAGPVPGGGALIVSFTEKPHAPEKQGPDSPQLQQLEDELAHLREQIRDNTEAASTSEENLKAFTEEITSMNEELRATNEELEASKEELRALNEELRVVNKQLHSKVAEVNERSADLKNLLASTNVPTLFLDAELKIRRFSKGIPDLISVQPGDTGRPIAHFVHRFSDASFERDCLRVLADLSSAEAKVTTDDGRRTYTRRADPYRAVDGSIAGVVVTFVDITATESARHYAESIVETVQMPLLVLHPDLVVRNANPAFCAAFAIDREDVDGLSFYGIDGGQWDIPDVRKQLTQVLSHDTDVHSLEVEKKFPRVGHKALQLHARRLDHVEFILLAIEDVTERKYASEQRALLAAELAHRVKNALAVVQSLAAQTLRRSASLDEFESAFMGRLHAYARSHEQLLLQEWRSGNLRALVESTIDAHAIEPERVDIDGPDLEVTARQGLALGLILHELGTNAAKYGALSGDTGRIGIRWSLDENQCVRLRWQEAGGPPPVTPEKEGFGSSLIRRLSTYELDGTTDFVYAPEGLHVDITYAHAFGSNVLAHETGSDAPAGAVAAEAAKE
ncbi:MAG: CheR family methyltransferase [Dehalococcoidia bacterium]